MNIAENFPILAIGKKKPENEIKFLLLAYNCIAVITVYFYHLMEILE